MSCSFKHSYKKRKFKGLLITFAFKKKTILLELQNVESKILIQVKKLEDVKSSCHFKHEQLFYANKFMLFSLLLKH